MQEQYYINWRTLGSLLGTILSQQAEVCWAIGLVSQLMAMHKLHGGLPMESSLSIQCVINGVGLLYSLSPRGAVANLEWATWFLTQVGTVLEHQCPLTYQIGCPDIVIGEKNRFRAGGVIVHHLRDYQSCRAFEDKLVSCLAVSPIAVVVPCFDSFDFVPETTVFFPTPADRRKHYELSLGNVPFSVPNHVMILTGVGINDEGISFYELQESDGDSRGSRGYIRVATNMGVISSFVEMFMPGTQEASEYALQNFSRVLNDGPNYYGMTRVQATYVPADDLTDPAPATTFAHLDTSTVLSRQFFHSVNISELGIYPAGDPLDSTSRMISSHVLHEEHYNMYALGEPIDKRETDHYPPVDRDAPALVHLATEQGILSTGTKVVDLLAPYQREGTIGHFGGVDIGKNMPIMELINNVAKAHGGFYVFAGMGEPGKDLYIEVTESGVTKLGEKPAKAEKISGAEA